MVTTTTISEAGAHSVARLTDRLPAMGGAATTTNGYLTPALLLALFVGTANIFTAVQTVSLNAASIPAGETGTLLNLGNADATVSRIQLSGFGAQAFFSARRANGTAASPTALQTNDQIGAFNWGGYGATAYIGSQASLSAYAGGNWTDSSAPTYLDFRVPPSGSTTLASQARLLATGNFSVGPNFFAGGASLGSEDAFFGRVAAAKWQLGAADAAAPVAQTLQVQSVVAGTSNTAGTDWILGGSKSTGTGAGGAIQFAVALAGSTGTAQNALTNIAKFAGTGHLLWNTDATYDIGAAGATRPRTIYAGSGVFIGNGVSFGSSGNSLRIINAGSGDELRISVAASATMQLGLADVNGNAVAQTIQGQSGITGTDKNGGNFTIIAGKGTGAGTPGNIVLQVANQLGTGTTAQTAATGLTIQYGLLNMQPSVIVGNQALATTATDGFLYIPTCAGTPTGVPTTATGRIAMIYDTTNDQFWFYRAGWKQPKTPAGAAIVTWQ